MLTYVLVVASLLIAALALAARYRQGFLAELTNSFLPYSFMATVLLLLAASLLISEINPAKTLLLLVGWLAAGWLGWPLANFAYIKPLSAKAKIANLRVATFNKLFTNDNIEPIFYRILHLKADVAGILEIKSEQAKQLAKLAKHHKLYFASHPYSVVNFQLALISKYPLRNQQFKIFDNYGVAMSAQLAVRQRILQTVLVHTAAPIIPSLLAERNRGLAKLADYLKSVSSRQLIVMGDFNLTPWSPTYRKFMRQLKRGFYNLARGSGLQFTWMFFGPVGAHIDHILANKPTKCRRFVVDEKNLGSDHKLIYTDLHV